MRHALFAAVLAALGMATPALSQEKLSITPELVKAAEAEGQLTLLYSSPLNAMQALSEAFNREFPRIRVNLERKAGASGVQALLQESAAGVHRIDVFQGTEMSANEMLLKEKLLAAIVPDTASNFPEKTLSLSPYLYYPDQNRSVIMYNPKLVTEQEAEKLKNWDGILDPAFRDRVSIVEPTFGVTLAPLLYVMNTPSLGEDFLKKLKGQNPAIFVNTAQARDAVVSGQKPISWGAQWESIVFSEYERGAPIRFIYPAPTVEYGTNGWGVLKNAPNPNAARLFFAWVMSRKGAIAMMEPAYNGLPAFKGVDDTRGIVPKLKTEPWFAFPTQTWNPDIQDWISNGRKYQETWTRIMKARG
ncbi:ABC transporter substrate-binding protein [Bosea sp. (in: a-proteobacteria)]|uniref:ABC transporter substrate-binding protein n=1 Tax=Bosea sp. (in: a-proteobacteria) TaxID=1871050 RepID=UPI00261D3B92|nr:extracellular solute-binding protein [Bosea sp. (in: a-proteobacteria)]MCO5089598.1 extracellular solute-binding protein [Bosea sp. (in: a-proteobacteria)]